MRKALIVIPHYFRGDDAAENMHDSGLASSRRARARALSTAIIKLHECFGPVRLVAAHDEKRCVSSPNPFALALNVVVVTVTGEHHLLGDLECDAKCFRRHAVDLDDPRMLGFEAHRVIGSALGAYDWYGYLEDDTVLDDPLFFVKLAEFNRLLAANGVMNGLVLPNRFESAIDCFDEPPRPPVKLFPDYQLQPAPLHDGPPVVFSALGRECRLEAARDPHAGCFFLDARQAAAFVASPSFDNRREPWATWLDTAATLAIWRTFAIYKLSLASAMTFDVRHARPLMMRQLWPSARGGFTWLKPEDEAKLVSGEDLGKGSA